MTNDMQIETVEQVAKYVEDFDNEKVSKEQFVEQMLFNEKFSSSLVKYMESLKQSVDQAGDQQKDGNSTFREGLQVLKDIASTSPDLETKREMANKVIEGLKIQQETTKDNNDFWLKTIEVGTVGVCCIAAIAALGYVAVKKA